MMITAIIKYIPVGLLIVFGWVAEIYWYQFRFLSDGNTMLAATIQGIALTIFLSVAVVIPWKRLRLFVLVVLIIYSVFATAAGQSYSLAVTRLENAEQLAQREQAQRSIDRIDQSIADKSIEIDRLETIKAQQTASIADQSLWRTALGELNQDIAELEADITALEAQKLGIINTGDIRPDDIYTHYAKLSGINVAFIESLFQLVLSLLIALMAPVGIAMFQHMLKPKAKSDVLPFKPKVGPNRASEFVNKYWPRNIPGPLPKKENLLTQGWSETEVNDIIRTFKALDIIGPVDGKLQAVKSETQALQAIKGARVPG